MIAIMSSTYSSIEAQANRTYLFDLYDIQQEFSRRSVAAPWPLNVPLFILDMFLYVSRRELVREVWGQEAKPKDIVDSYLRRNMTLENMLLHKVLCVAMLYQVLRCCANDGMR